MKVLENECERKYYFRVHKDYIYQKAETQIIVSNYRCFSSFFQDQVLN